MDKVTTWQKARSFYLKIKMIVLNKTRYLFSPFSSTVIALALIIVEVIINIIWLIAEPPTTDYLVDKGKNILVCGGVDVR